jgi:CRP/FNR family transcriptional regulator
MPATATATPTLLSRSARPDERIGRMLALLKEELPIRRRVVPAGERLYGAGDHFDALHIVHCGVFKTTSGTPDGRDKIVGVHFKGDWLGFDGIADGQHRCDTWAMDTSEVWTIDYATLLEHGARSPVLLGTMLAAMSRELMRDRDAMLALCTLPADARVADFLRGFADALERSGLRTDQITLPMTRAEIGDYLGMTLETVSRALTRLARDKVIGLGERARRDVQIPDVAALSAFVERSVAGVH